MNKKVLIYDINRAGPIKHGMSVINQDYSHRPKIYTVWLNMRSRCRDKNRPDYYRYGGRGIGVCKRWDDFASFYKDMGDVPAGMTLDRIENDKGYCKDNCRWVDRKCQSRNRDCTVKITYNGITKTVGEWSETLVIEINYQELYKRVFTRKWPLDKAMNQPLRKVRKA